MESLQFVIVGAERASPFGVEEMNLALERRHWQQEAFEDGVRMEPIVLHEMLMTPLMLRLLLK